MSAIIYLRFCVALPVRILPEGMGFKSGWLRGAQLPKLDAVDCSTITSTKSNIYAKNTGAGWEGHHLESAAITQVSHLYYVPIDRQITE